MIIILLLLLLLLLLLVVVVLLLSFLTMMSDHENIFVPKAFFQRPWEQGCMKHAVNLNNQTE